MLPPRALHPARRRSRQNRRLFLHRPLKCRSATPIDFPHSSRGNEWGESWREGFLEKRNRTQLLSPALSSLREEREKTSPTDSLNQFESHPKQSALIDSAGPITFQLGAFNEEPLSGHEPFSGSVLREWTALAGEFHRAAGSASDGRGPILGGGTASRSRTGGVTRHAKSVLPANQSAKSNFLISVSRARASFLVSRGNLPASVM